MDRQAGVNAFNPYLQGPYAAVGDEVTEPRCRVTGEIPRDLWGAYVRNGPNPRHAPQDLHHWFDGDGMLHGVYFENGRCEYRNRWVRGDDFVADEHGACGAGGVMRPANRERGARVYKDTANTDVLLHNGSLMALWYISGVPVRVHARTLETIGNENFGGKLPRHVSAHSKCDPLTGELVFFDYALYEPWMSYGVVDRHNVLQNFQRVELPGPRLPHDLGITENYVVLHDLPVVFNPRAMMQGIWSIEQPPGLPARFGIAPRRGAGSEVRWFETDPCYVYHVGNCWEDGDEVVMRGCRMIGNPREPAGSFGPYLPMVKVLALRAVAHEWRFNLRTGATTSRQLDERIAEFPVMNGKHVGRRSRYGYHMSIADTDTLKFDGICKYDFERGNCDVHRYEAGVSGSEAAFAPRVGAHAEDDGYLVVFTQDENSGASEVRILDVREPARRPLARVQLPVRVPLGFHATWANGELIRA
jgi:carotenoid cleavage dioxygenase-like enzyme